MFLQLQPAWAQTRTVQALNATNAVGYDTQIVIQGISLGNENSLGFSLGFDTNLLNFRSASLGVGATGASLIVNTNQIPNGRVGFALARPAGQRFSAGTNELLRLQFRAGRTEGVAAIAFGDQPIARETVDDNASVLTTLYLDGAMTITPLLAPVILTDPASRIVQPITNVVTNVIFQVMASGTAPLTYQWRWGGSNLAGATTTALTLTNVTPTRSGNYDVVVTNPGGAATSEVAILTVLQPLIPPSILASPRSQVVSTGETVTFTAQAGGSLPLSYQWRFNSGDIGGETNTSLILSNVTVAKAGNYTVRVSNGAGAITSPNALLTVNSSLRTVRVGSRDVATGRILDMPVELAGFGDENAIGFSLQFDPSALTYQSAVLGAGAFGVFLDLNTNQLADGRLGVALTKAPGQVFSAGVSTILSARFLVGSQSGSNEVSFGDVPILRELADGDGNARPAAFQSGYVNVLSTAPGIISNPQSQTAPIFSSRNLQVVASGSIPLKYQWRKDGVSLDGATDSTLTLPNVMPSQSGNYDVVSPMPPGRSRAALPR